MNTPAHLILGAAAFGKPESNRVTIAAVIGSLLPDLSLYVMAGVSLFLLGISPDVVFGQLYFSDTWQQVFAIDNSFILWGLALGIALWRRSAWGIALTAAALLHIALDFPLHNEDARMHFWPISDWKFFSPMSYWDSSSGGQIFGIIELVIVLAATAYLMFRFRSWIWRVLFLVLAVAQIRTFYVWYAFF